MQAIVRWNIGNVSKLGHQLLELSVKSFKKIYGNQFNYVIYYNNTQPTFSGVEWVNQKDFQLPYSQPLNNPAWKLYPPRIDINRHEIMIDNDIIIYNPIPIINKFLEQDSLLIITEGIKRSYDRYDHLVPSNININTGFIGLPPNFDFISKITNLMKRLSGKWESHFDEQAMVASIVVKENFELIPTTDISVCFEKYTQGKYGIHFVGANKNTYNPQFWKQHLSKTLI